MQVKEVKDYEEARTAITNLIKNREDDCYQIEQELRQVRRILDEEFQIRIKKKPSFLG